MANSVQLKTNPEIIAKLNSQQEETVLNAISDLRNSGSSAYIPLLAHVLLNTVYPDIKRSILSLFCDLKDKSATTVMVNTIADDKYISLRKELISACWQNGLDYSPYLSTFVDWVIESEMEVAFEAFTVIETLEHLPGLEERRIMVKKIEQSIVQADSVKTYLLNELLTILR
jgi:hypothetical protein